MSNFGRILRTLGPNLDALARLGEQVINALTQAADQMFLGGMPRIYKSSKRGLLGEILPLFRAEAAG